MRGRAGGECRGRAGGRALTWRPETLAPQVEGDAGTAAGEGEAGAAQRPQVWSQKPAIQLWPHWPYAACTGRRV